MFAFPFPVLVQTMFFALYAILTLIALRTKWQRSYLDLFLICASTTLIGLTAMYYLYALPKALLALITVLPLIILLRWLSDIQVHVKLPKIHRTFAVLITLLIDVWLVVEVFLSRTTELRASPWQGLDATFFLLFAVSSALIVALWRQENNRTLFVLSSLHLFVVLSIPAIMYPLGYGFDAFIHRATEDWIATHGVIQPKQPYYIGQYSIVVWLHHLTKISIFSLDVWLVPLLTSILLPALALKEYAQSRWQSLCLIFGYILLPFLSLHLTTPHNLVLLLALLVVILATQKKSSPVIILLLAVAASSTHPLVGIPTLLFALAHILYQTYKSIFILFALFIAEALTIPTLFILNNLRAGAELPRFANFTGAIRSFIELFQTPYWYLPNSLPHFEVLYGYERLIPIILIFLAVIALWQRCKQRQYWLFPITSVGLLISAFILRGWIVFPDIVAYEQSDFPLRLIKAAQLFLFPLAALGFGVTIKRITSFGRMQMSIPIILGGALMVSLYLTYPQVNAKVRFPGYNVTSADIEAVQTIAHSAPPDSYIVLSNQLTAAAALREFSFASYYPTSEGTEHFYYAIPTGGKLYAEYQQFVYHGQHREAVLRAMDYVGKDTAFVLVSKFWGNSEAIITAATKTADETITTQDGQIVIFRYDR